MSSRIKAVIAVCAAATALPLTAHAAPTVYQLTGTVTTLTDPNNLLNTSNIVGSTLSGQIAFGPEHLNNFMAGGDRLSDIVIDGGRLVFVTPSDNLMMGRYTTGYTGYLPPYNIVRFVTASASEACRADGGISLEDTGTFSFSFGCTAYQFGERVSPGFRISGTGTYAISGAVPEPATWATMMLGFGGIGFAMRRRKITPRFCFARSTGVRAS